MANSGIADLGTRERELKQQLGRRHKQPAVNGRTDCKTVNYLKIAEDDTV